jgi:thiosulfate/3-mercaptopyruvate sulfurtransferase
MERCIDAIVSTEWLAEHLGDDLVIIDIRWAEHHAAGHIPGAISVPFGLISAWADSGELTLELPRVEDLFKTIGDCGITARSRVVIVGPAPEPGVPPYALADPARVAATLMYAGVKNVAVLSGGHAKWSAEGRRVETVEPMVVPIPYSAVVDSDTWVSTEYVKDGIGKAVLIDGRNPEDYFGVAIDAFSDMRGHIATARCLPAIWLWEPDGTYRSIELIGNMVAGVVGDDKDQEVIAYCGAGGYASLWWFVLTQVLDYTNVKIYDGSMEAWVDEGNPIVAYTWTD